MLAVAANPNHAFSKPYRASITLLTGLYVEGDCYLGETLQHRSRLGIRQPPNLRQLHLLQSEIFQEVQERQSHNECVQPGELGENVITVRTDLLGLGQDTNLQFVKTEGSSDDAIAVVCVKELRNSCPQIEKFRGGLQEKLVVRD